MAEHMIKWFKGLPDKQLMDLAFMEAMDNECTIELAKDLLVALGERLKDKMAGKASPAPDSVRVWPDVPVEDHPDATGRS